MKLTVPLAADLYEISDKYLQSEMAGLCEDFLSNNLRLDNFNVMIGLTEKLGPSLLKDAIVDFITNNVEEIRRAQ